MKQFQKKSYDILFLVFVFAISFSLFYLNNNIIYNADHAYYIISGKDIADGNILLDGWYGSTNNFYLFSIIYALFGSVFGFTVNLLNIVASSIWSIFITLLSYMVMNIYKESSRFEKYARVSLLAIMALSSAYFSQTNRVISGYHIDVIVIGLIYAWLITREIQEEKKHTLPLIIVSILLVICIISDQLVFIFIILPLLCVLCINLIFKTKTEFSKKLIVKHIFLLIIIFVVSNIVYIGAQKVFGAIETPWSTGNIKFNSYGSIFDRIEFFAAEILYLFNCCFFEKTINSGIIAIAFRCFCLLILIIGTIYTSKKLVKNLYNQFLIVVISIYSAIFILLNYSAETDGLEYTTRLMYMFLAAALLLFAQIDWQWIGMVIRFKLSSRYLKIISVCILTIMMAVSVKSQNYQRSKISLDGIYNGTFAKVSQELQQRGLTQGYGTFWLTSPINVLSDFKVEVTPIINASDIQRYDWLARDTSDWDYANFVLVDDSMWADITAESIEESIGNPSERVQVDNVTIMIWDKNIMPYIDGSGYNGNDLDAWWSFDEGQTVKEIKVNNKHFFSSFAADDNGNYRSTGEGILIYGPYREINAGLYDISFEYQYENIAEQDVNLGYVDIYSSAGNVVYNMTDMVSGQNVVTLKNIEIKDGCEDVELRAYANTSGVSISKIIITKQE